MNLSIHREGFPYIGIFVAITLLSFWFIGDGFGFIGIVLTAWCVYFFRDPKRVTPDTEGLIISPADGIISMITKAKLPPELGLGEAERTRVSVFMNVFDCHVNRMPVEGKVVKIAYHPGQFLNASFDKSSELNERKSYLIEYGDEKRIGCVQIAGLVARRIVSFIEEGDTLSKGERFGMIRFGSRVDVYLEDGLVPSVALGQRCFAGETVLCDPRIHDARPPEPIKS